MYNIPRKRIQGFSLLCVFILLLHGPWCQLRLSVQWNQTGGMGAGFSRSLSAHQIWGWSLHTYLACLWGSQQFSQPCDHWWFQVHHCNHASSSQKPDDDFGAWPNKNLAFASLFGIVDILESISRTFTYTIMAARKDDGKIHLLLIEMYFLLTPTKMMLKSI